MTTDIEDSSEYVEMDPVEERCARCHEFRDVADMNRCGDCADEPYFCHRPIGNCFTMHVHTWSQ